MKAGFIVSAVMLSVLTAFGDNDVDKALKHFKDVVALDKETTAILSTVKDKLSAEAAVAKLEDCIKRFEAAQQALRRLIAGKSNEFHHALEKQQETLRQSFEIQQAREKEEERLGKEPDLGKILRKSKAWAKFSERTGIEQATMSIKTLEQAIAIYKTKKRFYPASLKILCHPDPVDKSPAILKNESVLMDPWAQPYIYEPQNRHPTKDIPLIYSKGPPGLNMAIRNWE